jgi:hypothetical protein
MQHRLPPAEASLGTLRSRASGPPSSPQTVRARHADATSASLFEITQTLAAPVPVHPRLALAIVPCNQDSAEQWHARAGAHAPALVLLLDGEDHADELCCQFEVGWPTLGRWLVVEEED